MKNQDGFTLIEMMVTLAIAAIMITTGVPAFQRVVQNNRQAAQSATLVRALQFARTEAVRRAASVTVCNGTASGGPNGTAVCRNNGNWSGGWIVFVDKKNPGVVDKTEKLLHVFPALDGGTTLTSHLGTQSVSYQGTGLSSTSGYFTLCDTRGGTAATAIDISATGAVHTGRRTDAGSGLQCS